MQLKAHHLTYCTNIHPGESWEAVWQSLKDYTVPLKKRLCPDEDFGVGLRLSDLASREILEGNKLDDFKEWLQQEGLYVFTMNGFPYGGFHRTVVKDQVHTPDWTTADRRDYTARLFHILGKILPEGMEGSISTSPLSYRYWHESTPAPNSVWEQSTRHVIEIAMMLHRKRKEEGIDMHLDLEPEPDGLMDKTPDVLDWYKNWLLPIGTKMIKMELGLGESEAKDLLMHHIRLCYDVCHYAIVYEDPAETFAQMEKAGIRIGKIQISAALKAALPENIGERGPISMAFQQFNESTYLHQVVAKSAKGELVQYPDLPQALPEINNPDIKEWRSHFHVPLFIDQYGVLHSTQEAIVKTLEVCKQQHITRHLEVETYTWEVLPDEIRLDLTDSIEREMKWVIEHFR